MARRRRARRTRRSSRRSRKGGAGQIKQLLLLAGLGFGLYMVSKGALKIGAPNRAPVATVDGRPVPTSIVTQADLNAMFGSSTTEANSSNIQNA